MFNAAKAIMFAEYALVVAFALVMAVDLVKSSLFNQEKKRMFAYTLPFAVVGTMAGVTWIYVINWEIEDHSFLWAGNVQYTIY